MSATGITVTGEMIEQGRKALTFGIMGCGHCCGDNPPDELDHLDFDVARAHVAARAVLEAVLPDIIQQAKAEALDERAVKLAETSIHTSHVTGQALSRCVDLVEHITKDEVIREAKAEALRDAAVAPGSRLSYDAREWLRACADRIEQGAQP